jgi:hypothetical protein
MNKIFRNLSLMLVAGTITVACADYNVTDNFTAEPDPTYVEPYKDLGPVKSYLNREQHPNMSLGALLKVADFNKQELIHAAAITNFDDVAFGTSLMSGKIINEKGVMNFLDMMDLLDHVEEIGGTVYGSPIVANANQADAWLKTLTAPIEIPVDPIHDMTVDYTTMEEFTGTIIAGKPSIKKNYDEGQNALMIPKRAKVYIVEGFDVDPLGEYTVTFNAKVDKDETIICTFCDNKVMETEKDAKKFVIKAGKWQKVVVESKPAEGATYGYLMTEGNLNSIVYIKDVTVIHNPDNHRPQTAQEKNDTIKYALNAWCDGLMKINEGRIKTFDLIEEPIDSKSILDNGMYNLKKGTDDQIFWQDALGNENYAPVVSEVAKSAFANHEGDPAELKFFISESGLDDAKKMESLMYWIGIWDAKGAKIDGINAKLNLAYSEDAEKQAANIASIDNLLDELAKTGKLIRLSNFDIKYQDVDGLNVAANAITEAQRQKLADYYGYIIKSYMKKIPNEKQAGICKGNMADTGDPVGLWAIDSYTKDWVRTATYKAFCDALQGE